MEFTRSRELVAEAVGTALLVATVVGSGIMADKLSDDVAVSLLGNTIPTGAILVVLITILGPVSGAHFNPAVSAAFAMRGDIGWAKAGLYSLSQIAGGVAGTIIAHAMFDLDLLQFSATDRTGHAQWLAEVVATFGLVSVIFLGLKFRADSVAWLVGLYITAAYWFTASTSFANPAVTIGRIFTDTFAGIAPAHAPMFIAAQFIGAAIAVGFCGWMLRGVGGSGKQS